jgi:hypothetical protein
MYVGASATVRSVPPSLVGRGRSSFRERYAGRNNMVEDYALDPRWPNFKTAALNHSATLPRSQHQLLTHWPWQTKVDVAAESCRRPPVRGAIVWPGLILNKRRVPRGEQRQSGADRLSGADPVLALPDQNRGPQNAAAKKKNPAGMRG